MICKLHGAGAIGDLEIFAYDDCQLRIYNNGVYTTCDNWKTIDAALGKFWYKDLNNNGQLTETYGIIAKKVIGEQILGENFQISNRSGSMQFTGKKTVCSIDSTIETTIFCVDGTIEVTIFCVNSAFEIPSSGVQYSFRINREFSTVGSDLICM